MTMCRFVSLSSNGNKWHLYVDYAEDFNWLEPNELIELGISDVSVRAEKAIVKITFTK